MTFIEFYPEELWNKGVFRLRNAYQTIMDDFSKYDMKALADGAVEPLVDI